MHSAGRGKSRESAVQSDASREVLRAKEALQDDRTHEYRNHTNVQLKPMAGSGSSVLLADPAHCPGHVTCRPSVAE